MKKLKKWSALLLAGVLTFSMGNLRTFAAEETTSVTVSLTGSEAPAVKGEIYEVTLQVSDAGIGGVQGALSYDAEKFRLSESGNVTVTKTFAEANHIQDSTNLIKDDKKGTIHFALLSDGESTDWITFNFEVTAESGTADFTLSNVKASNAEGTKRIDTVTTVDKKNVKVCGHAVDINGATIRTNGTADIRFEVEYDTKFAGSVEKMGVILIPTKYVEKGQELTVTTDAVYCGKTAAIKEQVVSADDPILYVNLKNSSTEKNLNTEYTVRAYIRLTDGTVIYSDNVDTDKNIDNGMSSRSCVTVAKAVAKSLSFTPSTDVQKILDKADAWTVTEYETVIAEINKHLQ